jgi:hypothetical protein
MSGRSPWPDVIPSMWPAVFACIVSKPSFLIQFAYDTPL